MFKEANILSVFFLCFLCNLIGISVLVFKIQLNDSPLFQVLINFFVLYSSLISISLYITLNLIQFFHLYFTKKIAKNITFTSQYSLENIGDTEYFIMDDKCLIQEAKALIFTTGNQINDISHQEKEDASMCTLITERVENSPQDEYEPNQHLLSL